MNKNKFLSARRIAHVDMDCFYASVAMANNPDTRGSPVIIGPDPRKGELRGVASTCNYEARRRGVHSGMPISKVFRLCPDAYFIYPDFESYISASQRIMDILESFADNKVIRQTSIDEAYIDISQATINEETPVEYARKIQWEIWRQEKLTCSIGLAPNMSVAKIATEINKPYGITRVDTDQIPNFLKPLPIQSIHGIGKMTAKRMNEQGLCFVLDLLQIPRQKFYRLFGRNSDWLWERIRGIDNRPISYNRHMQRQSMSHNWTFPQDIPPTINKLSEYLESMIDKLGNRLTKYSLFYKTISLTVRFKDFTTHSKSSSLPFPHQDEKTIREIATEALENFIKEKKYVRMLGLALSNLSKGQGQRKLCNWFDTFNCHIHC